MKVGDIIKLKTLEDLKSQYDCKVIKYGIDVEGVNINKDMFDMFGKSWQVCKVLGTESEYDFSLRGTSDTWVFRKEWIDKNTDMNKIKYESKGFDYWTQCPHRVDCYVGTNKCCRCDNFKGINDINDEEQWVICSLEGESIMDEKVLKRWMTKMDQRMTRAESWFFDKESNKVDGNKMDEKIVSEGQPPGQLQDGEIDNKCVRTKAHNLALFISANEKSLYLPSLSLKSTIVDKKVELANTVIEMLYGTKDTV
jgi:hypothetical protein